MRERLLSTSLALVVFLTMVEVAAAQAVQQSRTLIVNGNSGQVTVMQINGRSFIDLEALAQLANGSLGFRGNQIMLTLPGSAASNPTTAPSTRQPADSAFSKNFMKAGIEEMAVIREWRSAQANAIQNGYPVTATWVAGYRNRAAESLRLASVAASTDSDQQALQLLTNELDNMQKWSNRILEARKDMDAAKYMSPDALNDDPLFQKILSCAHSLASMAANGQFEDDGSCD
jgi:hypothetical protein